MDTDIRDIQTDSAGPVEEWPAGWLHGRMLHDSQRALEGDHCAHEVARMEALISGWRPPATFCPGGLSGCGDRHDHCTQCAEILPVGGRACEPCAAMRREDGAARHFTPADWNARRRAERAAWLLTAETPFAATLSDPGPPRCPDPVCRQAWIGCECENGGFCI